jgi:predicted lactoylglutathione lyase
MELGAFSISLAVKDINASKTFYEKFGFKVFGGDISQNWLILKNGDHVIGQIFLQETHESGRIHKIRNTGCS